MKYKVIYTKVFLNHIVKYDEIKHVHYFTKEKDKLLFEVLSTRSYNK